MKLPMALTDDIDALNHFIHQHPRLTVITGAGISTDSGIPDYRDRNGDWKRQQPVQHHDFMNRHQTRQRFWARSLIGWPVMQQAKPNDAHKALAHLEKAGYIRQLITQNVDGLHQQAGSARVTDLHGRSDRVICMSCQAHFDRQQLHLQMARQNPDFLAFEASAAPDGDADLDGVDFSAFQISDCQHCGGILKPDVVFFGDHVPGDRVNHAKTALQQSDALLVIGSSLMVYSGYRFCKYAQESNKPIAAVTLGKTRADDLLSLKLDCAITPVLQQVALKLTQPE